MVGGLKRPGLPLNLPPFGVENKEYENKSQPIDRFSSYIAIYNWTYQVMDSPTLYNLDIGNRIFGNFLRKSNFS